MTAIGPLEPRPGFEITFSFVDDLWYIVNSETKETINAYDASDDTPLAWRTVDLVLAYAYWLHSLGVDIVNLPTRGDHSVPYAGIESI